MIQTGPGGKVRAHALDRPVLTIGRSAEADIAVDDPYLAPIHARIERQADGAHIVRRMGLNPIVLRNETVLQTATMAPGDVIRLGPAVSFQFVTKPAGKDEAEKDATVGPKGGKEAAKGAPKKPLLKNPVFLGAVGVVYLALTGGVAYSLLQGDGEDGAEGPTAARVQAEAGQIASCLESARRLRALSPASFRGSVGGHTTQSSTTGYAALAMSDEPVGDALADAVAPIADAYRRATLAGLAAEVRGVKQEASRFYVQAFNLVPDINCSAAQFVMERRTVVEAVPEEE
nr:FHA domain-containing protein [Chthonobacter rhizosphaerae]